MRLVTVFPSQFMMTGVCLVSYKEWFLTSQIKGQPESDNFWTLNCWPYWRCCYAKLELKSFLSYQKHRSFANMSSYLLLLKWHHLSFLVFPSGIWTIDNRLHHSSLNLLHRLGAFYLLWFTWNCFYWSNILYRPTRIVCYGIE
jgi:hypothetical protein